ncbi:hypothetical protein CLV72_10369 [Allonocardiopsis opalescens]|uniref:Uncharacterized protein n=1 Tax=Allonocardiopsis opalescens TaxID=1144618 RepID=A0A2T0Q6X0_9ACTN|nr:hypothetical protein CLV72_10369 [Allonocardiopsis opalescens]
MRAHHGTRATVHSRRSSPPVRGRRPAHPSAPRKPPPRRPAVDPVPHRHVRATATTAAVRPGRGRSEQADDRRGPTATPRPHGSGSLPACGPAIGPVFHRHVRAPQQQRPSGRTKGVRADDRAEPAAVPRPHGMDLPSPACRQPGLGRNPAASHTRSEGAARSGTSSLRQAHTHARLGPVWARTAWPPVGAAIAPRAHGDGPPPGPACMGAIARRARGATTSRRTRPHGIREHPRVRGRPQGTAHHPPRRRKHPRRMRGRRVVPACAAGPPGTLPPAGSVGGRGAPW